MLPMLSAGEYELYFKGTLCLAEDDPPEVRGDPVFSTSVTYHLSVTGKQNEDNDDDDDDDE
jgi:hypothetical protein